MVGLYCEDCQTQRDALDRVSVWKSRSVLDLQQKGHKSLDGEDHNVTVFNSEIRFGSKMPLAVECTADLIRCKLLDASGVLKSHELILTYGLALVRFVNLITERKQKMVTIPLRHLAKELGNNLVEEGEEETEESSEADGEDEMDSSQDDLEKTPDEQKRQELCGKVRDVLTSFKNQQLEILNIPQETHKWDFKMPRAFLCFWQPLLRGLHSKRSTQILLEKMFDDLKAHARISSLRSQYLINWITKILKANLRVRQELSKGKKAKVFQNQDETKLLEIVPSPYFIAVAEASHRLPRCALLGQPSPFASKLLYLTTIYTQEDGAFPTSGSTLDVCKQPIYTVESLLKGNAAAAAHKFLKRTWWTEVLPGTVREKGLAEEEEEEEEMDTQSPSKQEPFFLEDPFSLAEKRKALQGAVWQVGSDELKWRNFPLGKLPGQTDDPDTLLVDNYTMMSALDQLENGDRKHSPNNVSPEWSGFLTSGLLWTQSELHKLKSGIQHF
ncbi:hypothetical protein E2320_012895 [Naja naja]|nr:hypothetical protein E2320_012895 [Naja naja]